MLLLDTQLLLWGAMAPDRLSPDTLALVTSPEHPRAFSVVSVWEVVIKAGLRRDGFAVNPRRFRLGLLEGGFREFAVTSEHALAVSRLPPLHKDPFDRLLLAQAEVEGATLLTADATLARYPGRIRLVA